MSAPDLDALLSVKPPKASNVPEKFRERRREEQNDRSGRTRSLALTALARLHADDYHSLYEQAKERIKAERGPLPGDES